MSKFFKVALLLLILPALISCARAADAPIALPDTPATVRAGATYRIKARYKDASENGILQIQLIDTRAKPWKQIADKWVNVPAGDGEKTLEVKIPADARSGGEFVWQGVLYDSMWKKQGEIIVSKIAVGAGNGAATEPVAGVKPAPAKKVRGMVATAAVIEGSEADKALAKANISGEPLAAGSAEWRPPGEWSLEWADEFNGAAGDETDPKVEKWYPMLGWTPEDFKSKTDKGLRWSGKTDETAWFYSTKTGNHWVDGQGNLLLRATVDKTKSNENGPRVETAYLQSGFPAQWEKSADSNVKWLAGEGKFVSPKVNGEVKPLYISARIRSDGVKGYSTWFAFWLFSQTRSYNNKPADGTEVDMLEIVKGDSPHFNNFFNVANHWYPRGGGADDRYFNNDTAPKAAQFVNLEDGNYHTYGIEWSDKAMKCSVDGQVYYTFTENIPTDPVDMMLLLTLEFQPNLWLKDAGDGRTAGPFVSDSDKMREMSRVLVDYVRVYRAQ